jgi:hypothetical protein
VGFFEFSLDVRVVLERVCNQDNSLVDQSFDGLQVEVIDESGTIYQGTVEMDDVTGKASITLSGVAAKPKSIRYPRHTISCHPTLDQTTI